MKLKMTLLAGLVVSQFAVADDHFRQHDAHVHGHVEFNIAQDGQDLLVEITAPGADVVGFEHAPKTDAEKAAMADAKAKLNNIDSILTIPAAASCKLVEAHVENTLEKGEHHDEHDHDHDHHDGHGEFSVQYQFSCEDVAKVTQIDTQWFTHFPSTEKVSVNLLTDSAQSATELTSGNTTIKF